ncbi:choice-of-anchor L domain-containing protein, partial [Pseudofulvibacter geojedonensis]
MKFNHYFLTLLVVLCSSFVSAQAPTVITTDNTTYTNEQLVEDIFVSGDCSNVSNISSYTGNGINGIAYFEQNGSTFPFENGIVLSTGNAMQAPGPSTAEASSQEGGWNGDTDLENVAGVTNTNNASFLQFDFIPPQNQIPFEYIFVSEEYNGNFECTFSDAFAFILTDLTTGTVTNIAALPTTDTGSTAVTCTNVRPDVPGNCTAANEIYFDQYNGNNSPIVYGGQTVTLTAIANVTAGNPYRIKLVIADQGDSVLDSAVFLKGGSFGLGIDLQVDGLQIINGEANACDGATVEINGEVDDNTQLPVSYQWSDANGPIAGETSPSLTTNQPGIYTLTGSFTFPDGTDCSDSESITIVHHPIPNVIATEDLRLCDVDNDNIETQFMLTDNDDDVLGGQDPALYTISYHASQDDANNNQNPLTSPHTNNGNPQQIFVRIHNNNNNNCYSTDSFNLILDTVPTATQPAQSEIYECDLDGDGQLNFDLTQVQTEVLNGQNPNNVTVTYHTDEQEANNDTNPIPNPTNFTNTQTPQTIWIRVDNNTNNSCYALTSITLNVAIVPVAQTPLATDPLLHACDEDNDVTHVFDLTTIDATILGGLDPALYTLTYHPSQADADANTNALPDNFQVNAFTTDVFVRLENNANTSCYTTTTFQLFIHSIYSSALTTPEDLNLVACDDPTNNGLEIFDLQQHANNILGGLVNLNPVPATLTFHLAEQDAIDDVNPITGDLANYNSPTQSVWVRIENNDWPSCYTITQFEIIVNPDPTPLTLTHTYSICENYLTNGVADFYLSNQDATFANNPNYAISYHPTLADAQNDTNAISDPHVVNNNDTVFIRIEDTTTGCVNTQATMDLEVLPAIVPTTPTEPLTMCDPDNDGISTEFDLTLMNTIIAGNLPPAEIYYFATLGQAELGPVNAADAILQSPYTNVVPYNQTI